MNKNSSKKYLKGIKIKHSIIMNNHRRPFSGDFTNWKALFCLVEDGVPLKIHVLTKLQLIKLMAEFVIFVLHTGIDRDNIIITSANIHFIMAAL